MSEIITICVGGCGTKVGLAFWEEMAQKKCQAANKNEHKVYYQRLFHEQDKIGKSAVPRAVFIDSDIKSNIQVCSNKIGFDTNSVVGYGSSCRNLFSEGKYGEGKQMADLYYQSIRNQVEKCDRLSGFVMIRSCQGGAGSGIGSLVLKNIRQEYPCNIIQQANIFGGIDNKHQLTNLTAPQICNIHLSISESIEYSDGVLFFQNNAISDILTRRKISPNFNELNKYLGHCLNQHVNAYINGGIINTSQRKRILNLLPFPTLKFLTSGLSEPKSSDHIVSALHTENRSMKTNSQPDRKMITINVNCRDSKMTENAIDSQVRRWTRMSFCKFLPLLPNQASASICHNQQEDKESSWVLYNGSINTQNLRLLEDQFSRINRRQAFLHNYFENGLEVYQINHAFSNVTDLTSQYKSLSFSADDQI